MSVWMPSLHVKLVRWHFPVYNSQWWSSTDRSLLRAASQTGCVTHQVQWDTLSQKLRLVAFSRKQQQQQQQQQNQVDFCYMHFIKTKKIWCVDIRELAEDSFSGPERQSRIHHSVKALHYTPTFFLPRASVETPLFCLEKTFTWVLASGDISKIVYFIIFYIWNYNIISLFSPFLFLLPNHLSHMLSHPSLLFFNGMASFFINRCYTMPTHSHTNTHSVK